MIKMKTILLMPFIIIFLLVVANTAVGSETSSPDTTEPYAAPESDYSEPESDYSEPESGYSEPASGYSEPDAGSPDAEPSYPDPDPPLTKDD